MVSARNRWEAFGPRSYEFDFQWSCFCAPDYTRPVRIRVEDGQVVSLTDPETGETVTPPHAETFMTIDGLYDWIAERIENKTYSETIEYSDEFSYPGRFDDDPMAHAIDIGKSFQVSNFRAYPVTPDLDAAQEQLDEARAKWAAAGYQDYTVNFQWTCWCSFARRDPVRIMVENDEVTSVTDPETGEPVPEPVFEQSRYRTIDGLFDWIQHEIDIPSDELTVEYADDFGYPLFADSDPWPNAIDDEGSFQISHFQPNS